MSYQDQIASVSLISEHIKESAQQAVKALEEFHNALESSPARKAAYTHVFQLNRVFAFIELKAAEQLTADIAKILKEFSDSYDMAYDEPLEAIIYAFSLLERYIDFICNKPFDLPQLLFSAINDLRTVAGMPPFSESSLFKVNHRKDRGESARTQILDDYEVVKVSRRLRQMYQMGLIEVIRKSNIHGGLNMMQRSLSKLDKQCGSPNAPNLWWIAQAAVEGFQTGGLIISPPRLKLFAKLDLQIRELGQINHNLNLKAKEQADELCFELLYLVSLSDAKDELTNELKAHYELPSVGLTERNLTQEFMLLKGLSDDDYDTLFTTILDDILKVQTDLIAEDYQAGSPELIALHDQLKQMHSLFSVLEYQSLEISLKEAYERIQLCINKNTALSDTDRRYSSDVLSQIETHLYEKRRSQARDETNLQRERLTDEKLNACKEARKQIHVIIKQLENYSLNDHDPQLLNSGPGTLQRTAEHLHILKIDNITQLLVELIGVFEDYFVKEPATIQALELLADILCSIEFYLETLENNHIPSPKIYQFADENLAKLKAYLNL